MTNFEYAARLNSFRVNKAIYWPHLNGEPSTFDLLDRASTVRGLNCVDLNYPDHLDGIVEGELVQRLQSKGMRLNGYAMRYHGDPEYKLGAFTHPDRATRRKAIDLTKRGLDSLAQAGGKLMTLWLGQDGFDYSFQIDYQSLWDKTKEAIAEVSDHDPAIDISLEYKPNEPRSFSFLPNVATTLLVIRDIGRANLGVTLDFAHVLYADEMPAYAAALVGMHSRLLGVHLNDGYGKRDDGLMVGSVHLWQTIELLYVIGNNYRGPIYFDTFPDTTGLDPVTESDLNISCVNSLRKVVDRLQDNDALGRAIRRQDAVESQTIVRAVLFGA